MLYGTLFTLPSATTALAEVGAWSEPIFDEFLPLIYLIIAIAIIVIIVKLFTRLGH